MDGNEKDSENSAEPFGALAGMIGSTPEHSAQDHSGDLGSDRTVIASPGDDKNRKTALPARVDESRIGPYKLLEQIGEGGMGAVYIAEQTEPVRRKVALKVIKSGMASGQIIARFEAERQALAMMDHPNIAKVFDAGTTSSGQPYFAMELVNGVPITSYCDKLQLSLRERLELFVQVCNAIQHAHQKGIIHRDIKPSNVMVALQDGKPVPKVIDFGVAKALNQKLTDATLYTQVGALIGTLEYMSPEQAEMSTLGIDARSDIYSLGVLLYELLTGSTPLNRKMLRDSALVELLRRIREEEPPKPSTRLTTANPEELSSIAKSRKADQSKLSRQLKGELDWIAMRALEKDRTRRYESANGLARDVERYLADEPVEACPPSNWYRARKFARRNKTLVIATGAVAAALVACVAMAVFYTVRERDVLKQRILTETKLKNDAVAQKEKAEQISTFLKDMLNGVGPSVALGRDTKMLREILDKTVERLKDLKTQPEVEAELRFTIAEVYSEIGEYKLSEAMHQAALEMQRKLFGNENVNVASSLNNLANLLRKRGALSDSEAMYRQALEIREKLLGTENLDVADSLNNLSIVLQDRGDLDGAEKMLLRTLAIKRKLFGDNDDKVVITLNNLAVVSRERGDYSEAESRMRDSLAISIHLYHDDHPKIALALNNLSRIIRDGGDLLGAETMIRKALDMKKKVYGARHPSVALSLNSLAFILNDRGTYTDAEKYCREALAIYKTQVGDEHPMVALSLNYLSVILKNRGDLSGAEAAIREALAIRRKLLGNEHIDVSYSLDILAEILFARGAIAESELHYRECLAIRQKVKPNVWITFYSQSMLGESLLGLKKYAESEPLLLSGFEGMKLQQKKIPVPERVKLKEAARRLARFYEETGNSEKATEWRNNVAEKLIQ